MVAEIRDLLEQHKHDLLAEFGRKLEASIKPLRITTDILSAKLANSLVARMDPLTVVPKPDGELPSIAYPAGTLMHAPAHGRQRSCPTASPIIGTGRSRKRS